MSELMQNVLAVCACLAAAAFVAWRAWCTLRGRSKGCGIGCGTCPSAMKPQVRRPAHLLSIDAADDRR